MIKLISPHGKEMKFYGTHKQIAKATGLSVASINSLATGRRVNIKGWLSCHNKAKKQVKYILETFTLFNIETKEVAYTWSRTNEFEKEHNISSLSTYRARRGNRPMVKNWIKKKTYDLLYEGPN